jgi:hypothetical protein
MLRGIINEVAKHQPDRVADTLLRLAVLAEGCTDHPEYRANGFPRSSCKHCNYLWKVKQSLLFVGEDPPAPREDL